MKLYNTLTRHIDEVTPLKPDTSKMGLYACGFTVYDYTHLGHLKKYTMDDVLIRTLRHAGFEVTFVQNVTDVGHLSSDADSGEDKLEKGAKKYNQSVWDVARKFEDYFWYSMDTMGNLRPDISCRATEHIAAQLEMVKTLEEKGFAYEIPNDGIYFDTAKLDDYGKLARLDLEKIKEGARVEVIEGKRNPTDFALWKFERPGENRAMVWPSPWAERSFPGWHIECSAMSMEYLGDQFEIHTGGIDHIPVHHTNEIAQAEAATGKKPFVKYWVHHNFLQVEGEKMSKSLDNFYTIDDVVKRGFSPKALRLLFLTSHYRSEMNFTWDALEGAQKAWDKLVREVVSLRQDSSSEKTLSGHGQKYQNQFFDLMEDDLKTPEAVALMWEVIKDKDVSKAEKYLLLLDFDQVFGLGLADVQQDDLEESEQQLSLKELPLEIQGLVVERQTARDTKDWATADKIRDQLAEQGYIVTDQESGQVLSKSPSSRKE